MWSADVDEPSDFCCRVEDRTCGNDREFLMSTSSSEKKGSCDTRQNHVRLVTQGVRTRAIGYQVDESAAGDSGDRGVVALDKEGNRLWTASRAVGNPGRSRGL